MKIESLEKPHDTFLKIGFLLANRLTQSTLSVLEKADIHYGKNADIKDKQENMIVDFHKPIQKHMLNLCSIALVPAGITMGIGAIGLMFSARLLNASAKHLLISATNHIDIKNKKN